MRRSKVRGSRFRARPLVRAARLPRIHTGRRQGHPAFDLVLECADDGLSGRRELRLARFGRSGDLDRGTRHDLVVGLVKEIGIALISPLEAQTGRFGHRTEDERGADVQGVRWRREAATPAEQEERRGPITDDGEDQQHQRADPWALLQVYKSDSQS